MKKILICFLAVMIILLAGCSQGTQSTKDEKTPTDFEDTFDAQDYYSKLEKCVDQIREITDFVPDMALVLGSGLGEYAENQKIVAEIPYDEIEEFPVSTVKGHDGKLIFCEIEGKKVVIMKGRIHYYEGYDIKDVILPIRVLHMLGANTVIFTNAVGAINTYYNVGDFVFITDHISSFVPSPLIGENIDELGERFTDMSDVYDKEMIETAESIADEKDISTQEGVLIQTTGPQYETPKEIEMYRLLGADVVGMSTVVEAIAARHMGMRICTISCVTNMAAGLQEEISHEEVQTSSDNSADNFAYLINGLIRETKI